MLNRFPARAAYRRQSSVRHGLAGLTFAAALGCLPAIASADARRTHVEGHVMEEIVISGRAEPLLGTAGSASQGRIGQVDLATRPILRSGELMEVVPGAAVTQHSGTGKANQYYLRGFNLDHGTDFAGFLDNVPLNQPTHGHGQGYLDLNPIIPELVEAIEFGKGPYYTEVGDFSSAGYARYTLARHLHQTMVKVTGGENDFARAVVASSTELGHGDLLGAVEAQFGNGPWVMDEDAHRLNGLLRYSGSHGAADWSVSVLGYDAEWDSTDQVPLRAVQQGLISRLGNIDPTLGGSSQRYSANAELAIEAGRGHYHANAYVVYSDFELFSNFTYFLDNPMLGDQITQLDRRWTTGLNTSYEYDHALFARPSVTTVGVQVRHDHTLDLALLNSVNTVPSRAVREDDTEQTAIGFHVSNETRLTDWLRARVGLRADHHRFDVASAVAGNSGDENDTVWSPKAALILGPWRDTEFYLNYGQSFHSNDARGTVSRIDPASGAPAMPVDPLVKSWGTEAGVRTAVVGGLVSTFSLWYLELDSELLFVGDAGTTEPQGGSHRYGIEWSNFYRVTDWLTFDLDVALTQSRFDDGPNDDIPNSVGRVITSGATVDLPNGLFGAVRLRHFGDSPLTEDGSVYADASTVVNLRAGYRWHDSLEFAIDVFNLFDSEDPDVSYFFASCLRSDPAAVCGRNLAERPGVEDVHLHPVEPRQVRATVKWAF